jgi:hypothetical protein
LKKLPFSSWSLGLPWRKIHWSLKNNSSYLGKLFFETLNPFFSNFFCYLGTSFCSMGNLHYSLGQLVWDMHLIFFSS